jgi:hypothetical protein
VTKREKMPKYSLLVEVEGAKAHLLSIKEIKSRNAPIAIEFSSKLGDSTTM